MARKDLPKDTSPQPQKSSTGFSDGTEMISLRDPRLGGMGAKDALVVQTEKKEQGTAMDMLKNQTWNKEEKKDKKNEKPKEASKP